MNNWILPNIQEDIAELRRSEQQRQCEEARQELFKKPLDYVILDAARWDTGLDTAFRLCHVHASLFSTKGNDRDLDDVAPYLFPYKEDTRFGKWLKDVEQDGLHSLYISSDDTLDALRKHFRHFLRVKTTEGKWLYFRFYDPEVLLSSFKHLTENQRCLLLLKTNYMLCEDFVSGGKAHFVTDTLLLENGKEGIKYSTMVLDQAQIREIGMESFKREIIKELKAEPGLTSGIGDLPGFTETKIRLAFKSGIKKREIVKDFIRLQMKYKEMLENSHTGDAVNNILAHQGLTAYQKVVKLEQLFNNKTKET